MLVGLFSFTEPYAIYGGHGTIRVVEEPLEVSRGTLQHVVAYRDVYQCGKPYLYCRGKAWWMVWPSRASTGPQAPGMELHP